MQELTKVFMIIGMTVTVLFLTLIIVILVNKVIEYLKNKYYSRKARKMNEVVLKNKFNTYLKEINEDIKDGDLHKLHRTVRRFEWDLDVYLKYGEIE